MDSLPSDAAKRFAERRAIYTADKINPQIIKDALRNYEASGGVMESEIDDVELNRVLRDNKAIEEDPQYQEWIRNRFGNLIKDSGIPNGKGIYTDTGNRRSFKARHVPATLENIVAQMRKEQETGIGLGGINLRGAATKAYSSVEEMRQESEKLLGEHIFDEEYDSYMKEFGQRLNDLTEAATKTGYDVAKQTLLEAVRDSKNKTDMKRRLQNKSRWIRYSDELTDDLWQLKQDVQNMPAPYFEAKPRRIVYPEEALAYILPDNADADVLQALEQRGYNVLTYKAGDEQDRLAKLNSVEEAKFSLRDGLKDDLQSIKNRTFNFAGGELLLGTTSDFLVNELGFKPLPYYMPPTKAYRAIATEKEAKAQNQPTGEGINYHGLGVDGLYEILDHGEKTIAAFVDDEAIDGEKRDDRLVLVTDVDVNGGLGVVVVEPNGKARKMGAGQIDANKSITVFDKQAIIRSVQKAFDQGRLLYIDKKSGHRFDAGRKGADCPTTIRESARKDNIQNFWANVKWRDMKNTGKAITGVSAETTNSVMSEAFKNAKHWKSERDTEAVRRQQAKDKARLDALRAEKNAKIEEVRKAEVEKRRAAVAKEKAAKWEKVEETKDYYRDMMKRQRDKRSDTAMRGKIKDLHKELSNMLLKPSENRYVPKQLVKATAEILDAVDITSGKHAGTETCPRHVSLASLVPCSILPFQR